MACFDDIDGTWFRKNDGDPWVAKFNGNQNYAHTYIRDAFRPVNMIDMMSFSIVIQYTNRAHISLVNSWGWKARLHWRRKNVRRKFQAISYS